MLTLHLSDQKNLLSFDIMLRCQHPMTQVKSELVLSALTGNNKWSIKCDSWWCKIWCMMPNAWVTLKPTVGRPDFFLCWSADKHGFYRLTGAVTLKTYFTDYLHRPQSSPFSRPSPDDRPTVAQWSADSRQTVFHCWATCNESADDWLTCGGLSVDRSYDIMVSVEYKTADCRPIVGKRSPGAEPITKTKKSSGDRKKNITSYNFF